MGIFRDYLRQFFDKKPAYTHSETFKTLSLIVSTNCTYFLHPVHLLRRNVCNNEKSKRGKNFEIDTTTIKAGAR